jgi:hypothetical protein
MLREGPVIPRSKCGPTRSHIGRRKGPSRVLARITRIAVVALCIAAVCHGGLAIAEQPEVPIRLQAELLAKVAGYDRNFAERAQATAIVLIAVRQGDPDSERIAAELAAELERRPIIGGVAHREQIVRYENPKALAEACRAQRASIVVLSAGFENEAASIASALARANVLSVSTIASYVERGVVLGFSARSGKPTILINLAQAKQQGVDFRADLLKLAKVLP